MAWHGTSSSAVGRSAVWCLLVLLVWAFGVAAGKLLLHTYTILLVS